MLGSINSLAAASHNTTAATGYMSGSTCDTRGSVYESAVGISLLGGLVRCANALVGRNAP